MADLAPTSDPIGRQTELDRLESHLDAVAHPAEPGGRAVALVGQAGFGKTSLLAATIARARARGFLVLSGRAWPLDAGLAYAPLLDAVGPWLRALDAERIAPLVRGLPDLGRLLPGLELPSAPALDDAALQKTRLFEAFSNLLGRAAAERPVALVIDDLHTADQSTVELLAYLLPRVARHALLVLLSWRTGARDRLAPVQGVLHRLARAGLAETVAVGPLEGSALKALARRTLGSDLAPGLVDLLAERAGGSPFFAVALLRWYQRTGDARHLRSRHELPPEIEDFIVERFLAADEDRRTLMATLAVGGDPVPWPVLCEATALTEERLDSALAGATAAGVVSVSDRDGVANAWITHPLAQEVVYRTIPLVHRQRMHRAFVEARERLAPDDLAHLARHYRGAGAEAGDPARALEVLAAAGRDALHRLAAEEAARSLQAAVSLARKQGRAELLPDLLRDLGTALASTLEPGAAESLAEAVELYDARGDPEAAGATRVRWIRVLWAGGLLDDAVRELDLGIARLEGRGPSVALAQLYREAVVIWNRLGRFGRIERIAERLVAWNPLPGRFEYDAIYVRCVALLSRRRYAEAAALIPRVTEVARTPEQRLSSSRLHATLAGVGASDSRALVERYAATVVEMGLPLFLPFAHFLTACHFLLRLETRQALAELDRADRVREGLDDQRTRPVLAGFRATALYLRGERDGGDRALRESRAALDGELRADQHAAVTLQLATLVDVLLRGDLDSAGRVATEVDLDLPLLLAWFKAEGLAAGGQVVRAERLATNLSETLVGLPFGEGLASWAAGLAATAAGREEEAQEALTASIDVLAEAGFVGPAARVRLERGRLTLESDPDGAREDLEAAHPVFVELELKPYAEQTRELLRRLGVRLAVPHGARRSTGLTERELEVARIAALGRTNAETGRALHISPHTVKSHLKRIYATLGLSSRAELTRWVLENLEGG